jgi:hypothetical protein
LIKFQPKKLHYICTSTQLEEQEEFLPDDVVSSKWLDAVGAQLYFWAKIYLFCLRKSLAFFDNCIRLRLGIKNQASSYLTTCMLLMDSWKKMKTQKKDGVLIF